ncbi:MAG: ATP-binding protein [Oscillospiraceae bacterium]|nr:ATP-binding protein [Oscillospiraceae bacterium]
MPHITDKRIIAVVGHYGSGKTEFSVSLAFQLAAAGEKNIAVVDLDIANPYFRSRERKEELAAVGVEVSGSAYDCEITAELPALASWIRKPLENPDMRAIVDVGGDNSGAKILNQFKKYFLKDEHELICVINRSRPETSTVDGALYHINAIENETGLKITALVSNTHFLMETTAEDVYSGWKFCTEVAKAKNIPVLAACCMEREVPALEEIRRQENEKFVIMPIGLHMRQSWLDRKL